jgi:hypothetical protein
MTGEVDDASVVEPVEYELDPDGGEQEVEHLLGDERAALVEVAADPVCPTEHAEVDGDDRCEQTEHDAELGPRAGLCRQGDDGHDPDRIQEIWDRQREHGQYQGVTADEAIRGTNGDKLPGVGEGGGGGGRGVR